MQKKKLNNKLITVENTILIDASKTKNSYLFFIPVCIEMIFFVIIEETKTKNPIITIDTLKVLDASETKTTFFFNCFHCKWFAF